ncbi:gamma carbonic anhydrase [Salimicrobium halophilum]|uniref:Carbonic anhydrase or acetyltransferase, isoleucine patch superfamily n=1 Tax=Salimicrobium halophilum TaxID=86666 RepID=A0A1G8VCD7_9BACI|nr:gamma carbonic anhydrase family protein [Salimicrobium halophilum]SDJ63619.1 Carbonic anhydrase or acetyltransferase, isoleucine patch superfamily [Salimicrobium halophilum]
MICEYKGQHPSISDTAYIAEDTVITGDVTIEEKASIWFKTVIRGDVAPVKIGKGTNVQDLSMLHQSPGMPLILEEGVTVGHQVTLHSATIKKNALIGMGSLVLDGATVEEGAFLGAGSLVPPGKTIPAGTLAMGRPAKVVRELTDEDYREMRRIRESYVEKGRYYRERQNSV